MRTGSLQRLLEAARALPGDRDPVDHLLPAAAAPPGGALAAVDLAVLRGQVGALLRDLAAHAEPALTQALARAGNAWDQADALAIVSPELEERARALQTRWRQMGGAPAAVASALEALLVIEAALRLLELVERRLATLMRLLLAGGGELLPDGRPFLDVPAALAETARGWA